MRLVGAIMAIIAYSLNSLSPPFAPITLPYLSEHKHRKYFVVLVNKRSVRFPVLSKSWVRFHGVLVI